MQEKIFTTGSGLIRYWTNDFRQGRATLVFLPGLTADSRLFSLQVGYFRDRFNVIAWDPPGHGLSRPFRLDFTLMEKAGWLHGILSQENAERPVLIGQSMGGYLAQCFMERYPGHAAGFVSIDSAPLQRSYLTSAEIWLLKHIEPVYRMYPWKLLVRSGSSGCATSPYGRELMRTMMTSYAKDEYCALTGHGFRMLAQAIEADLPYEIGCPAMLICGELDKAGSALRYNRAWSRRTGLRLEMIKGAGHNSNTDRPQEVNSLIEKFLEENVSPSSEGQCP